MTDTYNAGRAAGIREAAEVARECIYYDSAGTGFEEDRFDDAILALLDAPATAVCEAREAGIREALQAIADLPTGRNEDVMEGQEQSYRAVEALLDAPAPAGVTVPDELYQAAKRDAEEAEAYQAQLVAEAEIARLRHLIPRPDQTQDELVWRDHMRGVPLAALAKEFGITKERMRHRLKRIAENRLHLTGDRGASGE